LTGIQNIRTTEFSIGEADAGLGVCVASKVAAEGAGQDLVGLVEVSDRHRPRAPVGAAELLLPEDPLEQPCKTAAQNKTREITTNGGRSVRFMISMLYPVKLDKVYCK
jgi:hypothetical protein